MKKACWAVYKHSVSTDDDPQHQDCPPGADSWCKYQRALANRQDPPPANTRIPKDIIPWVMPVFESLCDEGLLEACVLGGTQNQNESFNAVVWARAPKTVYAQRNTIMSAVCQAVLTFNSGLCSMEGVMKQLSIQPGPLCTTYFLKKDKSRLYLAKYHAEERAKERRRKRQAAERVANEAHIAREGATYGAGIG